MTAPVPPTGPGSPATAYGGLVAVLRRYLSQASVDASLKTVLGKRGLTPERLSADDLGAVVSEAMVGLRMFCAPERVGDLMLDLADYCESRGVE